MAAHGPYDRDTLIMIRIFNIALIALMLAAATWTYSVKHEAERRLADINRREGLTLCVSLHNLELARAYFPRLIGMRAGRIVFDRPTAELTEEIFASLYELSEEEMLAGDAPSA